MVVAKSRSKPSLVVLLGNNRVKLKMLTWSSFNSRPLVSCLYPGLNPFVPDRGKFFGRLWGEGTVRGFTLPDGVRSVIRVVEREQGGGRGGSTINPAPGPGKRGAGV